MNTSPWEKLVSRSEDMLHWDSCVSIRRENVKLGDVFWRTRNDLIIKNDEPLGTWFVNNDHQDQVVTNLDEYCKEISTDLSQWLDDAIAIVDRDLEVVPVSNREDLRELYMRFRLDMGFMIFGLVCVSIPKVRLEASLGADRWKEAEKQALAPHRRTLIGREGEAIYAVQKEMAGNSEEWLEDQAEKLAKQYGFFHSEYVSESWRKEDYLKAFKGTEIEPTLLPELDMSSFSDYEKWLVEVCQKMYYLHDEGKSALVRTNWAMRESFKTLSFDDTLLHLTEPEFLNFADTSEQPSTEIIAARGVSFAILSLGDEYKYFSGKNEVEELIRKEGVGEAQEAKVTEFKGSVASKGHAIGRVRIIQTQEDAKNLIDGEILIASMTTPAYIDAMRRAAAYVTDEGGTICHAAIIAREYKKPCVVGTKVATKVLKNGDMIEVDAEKGIIKILAE
jgi:phosphohistidine swiveling domain-containing protein